MGPPKVTKMGKYEVLDVIGRGGMGMVYKAIDPTIGRMVAIKKVTAVLSDDPDLLKRFYREAQSTGKLQHPNIVTLHDLGDQDGVPYLVMEYLEGDSLEKVIRERRPATVAEKLSVIIQVCDGLGYAHQRQVIHRDIKPGNVVLLSDGGVKIVDFGIAQFGNERYTATGQVVGSLSYMSPEQIHGADIDSRSDIYSTGVVLFEYLAGSLPFQGKDPTSTLAKILHDSPPSLANFLSPCPPELDDVVRRALAKDRNSRYASMEDFAFDLQTVREKLSRDLIASYLRAVDGCMESRDWEKARDNLRQVLKLDKQHRRANELLREVQAQIQRQQINEQVRKLRVRADEALGVRNWDEALALLDQAVRVDSTNAELVELRDSVRRSSASLAEALRQAESAHTAGDLDTAKQAVEKALEVDPFNTTAKALNAIISKELAERDRRNKIDELTTGARKELALRNFTAALELLGNARAIDPGVAEVQQLIRTATAGREHERRRQALESVCREIEDLLNRDEYAAACARTDEALQSFPQDLGLLKLKVFAERRREAWSRRLFIESQMASAQQSIDSGQLLRAQSLLNETLERYPDDAGVLSLLATVTEGLARQEAQRREAERQAEEKRRYISLQLKAAADLQRTGQTAQALKQLREATIHYPDSEELKKQILIVEDMLAREEAARQRAELEARQKKAEIEQAIAASWQLLSTKQTAQALAMLEQSFSRHPDSPDLKSQLEFAQRRLAVEQAERERAEQEARRQRAEIQREVASAQQLLDSRQTSRAAAGLELALGRYPENKELKSLLQIAQNRMAVEQAERDRAERERHERAEREQREKRAEIEKELASAQRLLDAKRTTEAVPRLQQALRRWPDSEELKAQLEFAQQRLAAEETARKRAEEEQKRRQAWIEAEITVTRQWMDAKQADRAVTSLQQALTQYPENEELKAQLEFARRRLAAEQAERERAEQEALRKKKEIEQEKAIAWQLLDAGKAAQSEAGLEKAVLKFPESEELRSLLDLAKNRRAEQEAEQRRLAEVNRRKRAEIEREIASARQLLHTRQAGLAVNALELVLRKYPDNVELKSELDMAKRQFAVEEAEREKAAQEARRRQKEIESEVATATRLLDSGQAGQAVVSLEQAVRRFPDSVDVKSLLERAKRRVAEEEAEKLRAEQEKRRKLAEIASVVAASRQMLDSGQTGRALATLEQALRSHPESGELNDLFAAARKRFAAEQAERERAEQEARRRQAEVQKEITAARQLLDSKETAQAMAALESAAQRFPESKDLQAQLEFARQRLAREQEEKRQAEEQARRRRAEIEAQITAARQLLESNQTLKAVDTLELAIKKYPESEGLRSWLDTARGRLSRERAAQEKAAREAQLRKQNIAAAIENSSRLLKSKDTARALAVLEEAARSYPESDELRSLLATTRQQASREAAEREQEERRRAQLQNECTKVRFLLDRGEPAEALQTVDAALRTFGKVPQLLELQKTAKAALQQKKDEEKKLAAERQQEEEQRRRRDRDLADLQKLAASVSSGTKPAALEKLRQKVRDIAARYPGDGEIQRSLVETESALKSALADLQKPKPQPRPQPQPTETLRATTLFSSGKVEQAAPVREAAGELAPDTKEIPRTGVLSRFVDKHKWTVIAVVVVLAVGLAARYFYSRTRMAPHYTVNVESKPSGATVQVGNQTCVTPDCSLSLPAGKYKIDAELPGYQPLSQDLVVDPRQPVPPLKLVFAVIPHPETAGYLVVKTGVAGADVLINKKKYGRTDSAGEVRLPLDPGPYTVEVQKPGYEVAQSQHVVIGTGIDTPAPFLLKPLPNEAELMITGAPPRAQVQLDGRELGFTGEDGGFSQSVEPGRHEIVLVKDGHRSNAIMEKFKARNRLSLDGRRFIVNAPPPSPAVAQIVVNGLPHGATVKIDGGGLHQADASGAARFEVPAGMHVLEITAAGFTSRQIERSFAKGEIALDGSLERVDTEKQQYEAGYQRALQQYQQANDKKGLETARENLQAFALGGGSHSGDARKYVDDINRKIAALNPPPPPPSPAKPSLREREEPAIRSLMKRYEQAFDARDADALLKIWPNMGSKKHKEYKTTFAAVSAFHMEVDLGIINISENGETATANALLSQALTLKDGGSNQPKPRKDPAVFELTKSNGNWFINNVR